jgi:HlyD family type I secretion membrane fusion protein
MARAKAIPEIGNTMDAQRQEFVAKRAELTALREILTQRVTSNTDLIKNLQIILKDRKDRLASIEEEVRVSDDLLLKGLTTRDRNYNLRRQLAVDQEQIKNLIIQIDEKANAVNEAREQLNRAQAQREKELTDEILKLQAAIIEYNENIRYLSDVTGRSEARAPVSGIIVKVATNTRNQVIKAGEPLFEIFPDGVPLGVEIKVPPTYIDTVFIGQGLSLRFPSRERESSLKTLEGTVTFVSRDSEVEERTGRFFYTVRASIDPKSAEAYGRITPGNVGEVYFRLQDQTLFWYLFEPMFLMSTKTFVG